MIWVTVGKVYKTMIPYQHVSIVSQPGVVQGDLLSEIVPDVAERLGERSLVEPYLGVVFVTGKEQRSMEGGRLDRKQWEGESYLLTVDNGKWYRE